MDNVSMHQCKDGDEIQFRDIRLRRSLFCKSGENFAYWAPVLFRFIFKMRICCIADCTSCQTDCERTLFGYFLGLYINSFRKVFIWLIFLITSRINDSRKQWVEIIQQHQPLDVNSPLFICDLHFRPEDIKWVGFKPFLNVDAVLTIKYILIIFSISRDSTKKWVESVSGDDLW